jgi:hypothetical protein
MEYCGSAPGHSDRHRRAVTLAGSWYLTELVDAGSRPVTVCSWLKQTTCTKVTCESKSDWDAPTQLIKVRKLCSDVSVLTLKIVEYMAGAPPRAAIPNGAVGGVSRESFVD